jgi:hypothetical protein
MDSLISIIKYKCTLNRHLLLFQELHSGACWTSCQSKMRSARWCCSSRRTRTSRPPKWLRCRCRMNVIVVSPHFPAFSSFSCFDCSAKSFDQPEPPPELNVKILPWAQKVFSKLDVPPTPQQHSLSLDVCADQKLFRFMKLYPALLFPLSAQSPP